MTATQIQEDPRRNRSRMAILNAFVELVLIKSYDDIQVNHIIRQANIGRSTFYEHFKGKDELLAKSLHGPMKTLSSACEGIQQLSNLTPILQHFWDNRTFARYIFSSSAKKQILTVLSECIKIQIQARCDLSKRPTILKVDMHAMQIAESQFSILIPWLTEVSGTSLNKIALALVQSSSCLVDSCFAKS